jgi:hypothetical protein
MWLTMRVVLAAVLGGLAVLLAIVQIAGMVSAFRQKRSHSWVPFIGAILGIAACLVAPWRNSVYAIPVFLVLDPTPAMFVVAVFTGRFGK